MGYTFSLIFFLTSTLHTISAITLQMPSKEELTERLCCRRCKIVRWCAVAEGTDVIEKLADKTVTPQDVVQVVKEEMAPYISRKKATTRHSWLLSSCDTYREWEEEVIRIMLEDSVAAVEELERTGNLRPIKK